MADARLTVTVRVRDLASMKLLLWQLEELRNRMMLVGDPFTADLDRIINRPEADEHAPEDDE